MQTNYVLKRGALEGFDHMTRIAATEGAVLVKNNNQALPLAQGSKIALFGRMQFDYVKSGTGSGGSVNVTHVINIYDALAAEADITLYDTLTQTYHTWLEEHPFNEGTGAWASEPWSQEEMTISDELAQQAAAFTDTAVVVIGRSAGEDHDNAAEQGGFFLSDIETAMLKTIRSHFKAVIVLLNTGHFIDMSWEAEADAILYLWQGGMEGGAAAADLVMGRVCPSGKLSATAALEISDYPSDPFFGDRLGNDYGEDIYVGYRYFETFAAERVRYPFGYGLSYTTFALETQSACERGDQITVRVNVTNIGSHAGREVAQLYFSAPQGKLGRPVKELCAYEKTKLLAPGEAQVLELSFPVASMAAYDDTGATGHCSCFVLEEGMYTVFIGTSCRDVEACYTLTLDDLRVVSQLRAHLTPNKAFDRMRPTKTADAFTVSWERTPERVPSAYDTQGVPAALPITGDLGIKLWDVKEGRHSLDAFIAQIPEEELLPICFGEGMNSPKVTPGTGAAFGGVTDELQAYGIPLACCSDGPSGIRMDDGQTATGMPNGMLLACSWDRTLQEELYMLEGKELQGNRIDVLLGPGINIQRHPLCGRNFEYFSEDPYLCGTLAAAQQRGMAKFGTTGTIKHFVCNNQESNRQNCDARVSERALREIYLRPFEIAVRDGSTHCVMTAYSPINGVWTASNRELVRDILRGEWGFEGIVMTDWWARMNTMPGDEPTREKVHAMVRATNDLYMVCDDAKKAVTTSDLSDMRQSGAVTLGEVQFCARNICRFLLQTAVLYRDNQKPFICQGEALVWSDGGATPFTTDPALLDKNAPALTLADLLTIELFEAIPAALSGKIKKEERTSALRISGRNAYAVYALDVKEAGQYEVTLVYASELDKLAQISCQVIIGDEMKAVLSLGGTNGKLGSSRQRIELPSGKVYFKLRFPSGGYIVKTLDISKA